MGSAAGDDYFAERVEVSVNCTVKVAHYAYGHMNWEESQCAFVLYNEECFFPHMEETNFKAKSNFWGKIQLQEGTAVCKHW